MSDWRFRLALWAMGHWVRSGLSSRPWRAVYGLCWYLLYPRPAVRRSVTRYHRRNLAVLQARKRLRVGGPTDK